MSNYVRGGKKAAETNKKKYGDDYYAKIALKSQEAYMSKPKNLRKPRGFAAHPELASSAGKKGGMISRSIKEN